MLSEELYIGFDIGIGIVLIINAILLLKNSNKLKAIKKISELFTNL